MLLSAELATRQPVVLGRGRRGGGGALPVSVAQICHGRFDIRMWRAGFG